MTVVLVHGNPETPALWDPLCGHLGRSDVIASRLPGFGGPTPPGFTASRAEYVAWLIAELERVGEPVDLVGHDWGGGFVVGVAMQRPDLLRSWASDVLGLFEPRYVWHDMAQVWQTPGAGEEAVAAMAGLAMADRIAMFEGLGVPTEIASDFAGALDDRMGECILALYRSAAQPAMASLAGELPAAAARPGLAIVPAADPYTGGTELAVAAARVAGAAVEVLEGRGHWWMLEDPAGAAALLERFWAGAAAQ